MELENLDKLPELRNSKGTFRNSKVLNSIKKYPTQSFYLKAIELNHFFIFL
jgi:hypothetical protein